MGLHESSTEEKISMPKKFCGEKKERKKRKKGSSLEENPQMGCDAVHEGGVLMGNKTDSWPSSF